MYGPSGFPYIYNLTLIKLIKIGNVFITFIEEEKRRLTYFKLSSVI